MQKALCSLSEAWDFFSNPQNLGSLTPPEMKFEVLDPIYPNIYEGMLIRYKVSPFGGIKLNWTSEITKMVDQEYFIDVQVEGPFQYWHHEHRFKETPKGGVEIIDLLHYKLPMNSFTKVFHTSVVRKKLDSIFAYRQKKVAELYGQKE